MTQDRGAATRQRLLDAAVDSLRTHGVSGLTSRQIARTAGANLQAITYHFGSKDELVAQALTGLVRERTAPARAALAIDGDPAERLVTALRAITAAFAVGREDLAAYAGAAAAASTNPALARALAEIHTELVDYLATLMRQMQADGYLGPWVRPSAMAELLVAIGDGVAMHALYGEPDVDGVLDQVALLLLAARDQKSRILPAATRAVLKQLRKA